MPPRVSSSSGSRVPCMGTSVSGRSPSGTGAPLGSAATQHGSPAQRAEPVARAQAVDAARRRLRRGAGGQAEAVALGHHQELLVLDDQPAAGAGGRPAAPALGGRELAAEAVHVERQVDGQRGHRRRHRRGRVYHGENPVALRPRPGYHYPVPELLSALAASVAARLIARKETIAISESSTGGLISAALLSIPGASAYFVGGGVIYTQTARRNLLHAARRRGARHPLQHRGGGAAQRRTVRERLGTTLGARRDRRGGPHRQSLRRRGRALVLRGRGRGGGGPHARDGAERSRSQHVGLHPGRPRAARHLPPTSGRDIMTD